MDEMSIQDKEQAYGKLVSWSIEEPMEPMATVVALRANYNVDFQRLDVQKWYVQESLPHQNIINLKSSNLIFLIVVFKFEFSMTRN